MRKHKIDKSLLKRRPVAGDEIKAEESLFLAQVFVCISFLAVLFFIGFLSLILTKPTVSEYEKRELAKMPEFSLHELFWGSYLRDVEMYYADTFPFRDSFVQLAARVDESRGIRMDGVRLIEAAPAQPSSSAPENNASSTVEATPTVPDISSSQEEPELKPYEVEDDGAIGEQTTDGIFIYKDKAMAIFGGNKSMGTWYAETLNAYAEKLGPDVHVYDMVIPTAIEFGLPERYKSVSNSEKAAIDHIYETLDGVTGVDAYTSIQYHAGEYVYFNTDHHWTGLGAYYAYRALAEAAGFQPLELEDYEVRTIDGFLGTLYNQSNDSQLKSGVDKVDYFVMPGEYTAYLYEKGALDNPIETTVWAEYASGGNAYSVFIHGDYPLFRIDTDNKNGRKAVVVKESYGNAFAPFLIPHYEQVFVVDHRYYDRGLITLIKEQGITDVIFIKNVFAANTAYHIEKIEGIMY